MTKYSIALIGAGNQALFGHIPALKNRSDCQLSIVSDPSEQARKKIAAEIGSVREFESLEDADLTGIDAAIVCSPSVFHFDQTKYLLSKNIHVFCEKPLSTKYADAKALFETAKDRKLVLQAGYNRRFQPVSKYLVQAIQEDKYGKLNQVIVRGGGIVRDLPPSILNPSLSGGGIMMDYGAHYIDRLCSWFHSLDVIEYADDSRGGVEVNARAVFRGATAYWNNVEVIMSMSWTNDMGDTITLNFENISLTCTINNGWQLALLAVNRNTPFVTKRYAQQELTVGDRTTDIRVLQWNEFLNGMSGEAPSCSNLADAVRTAALVEQCYSVRKPLNLSWGL